MAIIFLRSPVGNRVDDCKHIDEFDLKDKGIDINNDSRITSLFKISKEDEVDVLRIQPNVNQDTVKQLLENIEKDEVTQYIKDLAERLITIKENKEYFKKHGFRILFYKKDTIEIYEYLKQITKEVKASDDLSNAQTID